MQVWLESPNALLNQRSPSQPGLLSIRSELPPLPAADQLADRKSKAKSNSGSVGRCVKADLKRLVQF
jgi:hypothetical protein